MPVKNAGLSLNNCYYCAVENKKPSRNGDGFAKNEMVVLLMAPLILSSAFFELQQYELHGNPVPARICLPLPYLHLAQGLLF